MNTHIATNNKPRPLLHWDELTPKEQKELDYIKSEEAGLQFVRYRGWVYDIYDMMAVRKDTLPADSFLRGWDAYLEGSYFSAVLMRWVGDDEGCNGDYHDQVVMGTWTC